MHLNSVKPKTGVIEISLFSFASPIRSKFYAARNTSGKFLRGHKAWDISSLRRARHLDCRAVNALTWVWVFIYYRPTDVSKCGSKTLEKITAHLAVNAYDTEYGPLCPLDRHYSRLYDATSNSGTPREKLPKIVFNV